MKEGINKKNLLKTVVLLRKVQRDKRPFNIATYRQDYENSVPIELAHKAHEVECGSAACAIGYTPEIDPDLFYAKATRRSEYIGDNRIIIHWGLWQMAFFNAKVGGYGEDPNGDCAAMTWMFGGQWMYTDNTVEGCIKRIIWYLRNGTPENYGRQMVGLEPLCYSNDHLVKPTP